MLKPKKQLVKIGKHSIVKLINVGMFEHVLPSEKFAASALFLKRQTQ
jgi:hypothetical protein